jgi:hypothetical protein
MNLFNESAIVYSSDGCADGTIAVFHLSLKKVTSSLISIINHVKLINSHLVNHYGPVGQIHLAVNCVHKRHIFFLNRCVILLRKLPWEEFLWVI